MRAQVATLAIDDLSLSSERLRGSIMSHRDWLIADSTRAQLRQRWRELFTEFDVVLCPVVPTPAFRHDQSPDQWRRTIEIDGGSYNYGDQLVWAGIASAPGLPSTVVPVGRSDEGVPIGVQIIGPMYEDWTSLRFAEAIERNFGGFEPPLLDAI
jgi:amidase